MSELPEGIEPAEEPVPRESAIAIVLRRGAEGDEVLLGVRSRRSRFLPGYLAFPGGRLDALDGAPDPAAWARCATRELCEETGLGVAPERWLDAGERTTPPLFPVRFHTRFFLAEIARTSTEAEPRPHDAENESLAFAAPAAVLDEWARGESLLPPPVLPILRVLAAGGGESPAALAERIAAANRAEERVPRIEFYPGVWMLPLKTATLPPATHTNVWIPGGRRFVVIDPGSDDVHERERLLAVVARRSAGGDRALAVLLTHEHRDHTAGAAALARELGLPLRAHPRALERVAASGIEAHPLVEGERIDLDGETLEALETPGHAPGHLVFHLAKSRLVVGGDLVSGMSTILIDPDSGDMGAYLRSLERLRALDCRAVLPGHGPPLPASAVEALIEHRRRRESRILELIEEQPRALDALAHEAYADVPAMPLALTRRQTLAHLAHLERTGRAARDGERWRAAHATR